MALLVLGEGIKVNAILDKNGFVPTKCLPFHQQLILYYKNVLAD